jgi:hypothetical protein
MDGEKVILEKGEADAIGTWPFPEVCILALHRVLACQTYTGMKKE